MVSLLKWGQSFHYHQVYIHKQVDLVQCFHEKEPVKPHAALQICSQCMLSDGIRSWLKVLCQIADGFYDIR